MAVFVKLLFCYLIVNCVQRKGLAPYTLQWQSLHSTH